MEPPDDLKKSVNFKSVNFAGCDHRRSHLGAVAINPVIYAEEAFAYEQIELVEEEITRHFYGYRPILREAAFLAARAHANYRARAGSRHMILPDFLIGAHAVMEQSSLLTRGARRYRQAFPGLRLFKPPTTNR